MRRSWAPSASAGCSSYGQCVSLPFWTEQWRPTSWYEKIAFNRSGNLHTLCLLDIKVKEPDYAHLAETGRTRYLPPRFMTINQAVEQLLSAEAEHGQGVCGPDARAVGLARLGQADERIVAGTLAELRAVDFGAPLHASCSARRPSRRGGVRGASRSVRFPLPPVAVYGVTVLVMRWSPVGDKCLVVRARHVGFVTLRQIVAVRETPHDPACA